MRLDADTGEKVVVSDEGPWGAAEGEEEGGENAGAVAAGCFKTYNMRTRGKYLWRIFLDKKNKEKEKRGWM